MADNMNNDTIVMTLAPNKGANTRKRRVGRGHATGWGKTCGKGHKGQKSRKGSKRPYVGFEGGQMPLFRRLPKRGFNNLKFARVTEELLVSKLNHFNEGDEVTIDTLKEKKLVAGIAERVKIIAGGELSKKLNITIYNVTKGAKEALEKSGSTLKLLVVKEVKKGKKKKASAPKDEE
jgi:large subunit ribosomal protein L15